MEELRKYPNYAEDPNPAPLNAYKEHNSEKLRDITDYKQEILSAYQKKKMIDEILWMVFKTSFSPHTIRSWSRATVIVWRDFLMQRVIKPDGDRTNLAAETIIELLYFDKFKKSKKESDYPPEEERHYENKRNHKKKTKE